MSGPEPVTALPPLAEVLALALGPAFDRDEEADFAAYTRALTVRIWPWLGVMLALSAILWWPLDPLLFRDQPDAIVAFATFRPAVFLLDVTLALTATRVALFRRHAHLVATIAAWCNLALSGWLLAEAGQGDPRWLSFAYILPIFSVLLLVPLAARTAATVSIPVVVLAAWLTHPAARPNTVGALPAVSYLAFISALCIFIGHILFVQVRRSFQLTRTLDRQRRELRDLADALEEQVAAKTAQVRTLSDQARQIRSEQRREIARDLHDGIGQELTSLRLWVGVQQRLKGSALVEDPFSELDAQVARIQDSLRGVLQSIRPDHLEQAALLEALANLADEMERRSGLRCRFVAQDAAVVLPAPTNLALYRIAQEAITNAVRHARARSIEVRLEGTRGAIALIVQDDGRGFDPGQVRRGFGTQNITERAAALGGTARWTFDGGTRLHVVLPMET